MDSTFEHLINSVHHSVPCLHYNYLHVLFNYSNKDFKIKLFFYNVYIFNFIT